MSSSDSAGATGVGGASSNGSNNSSVVGGGGGDIDHGEAKRKLVDSLGTCSFSLFLSPRSILGRYVFILFYLLCFGLHLYLE